MAKRGDFLKRVAVAGTAAAAAPVTANAQGVVPPASAPPRAPSVAPAPSGVGERSVAPDNGFIVGTPNSDYMVDVLKALGIEYVAAVPGSSFRGLHESMINYGMVNPPSFELLTCLHEEASVAMAHGYAKIAGKPMACAMHTAVGLQHGSMAIYNAYADRVPIFMITANQIDANKRRSTVPWYHTAQDAAAMVRDFIKWDDAPASLVHFAESAVRAYQYAMTPPYEPVLLTLDSDFQEDPIGHEGKPRIPKIVMNAPPIGDTGAVEEAARLLVGAQNPVIMVDRVARTQAGCDRLVQLAELLGAPVVDYYSRMNMPWRHPLYQTFNARSILPQADVVIGMEMSDFWSAVNQYNNRIDTTTRSRIKAGAKTINLSSMLLNMKSNYQDFEQYLDTDVSIAADAEATLPSLIEACRRLITPERRSAFDARARKYAEMHQTALQASREAAAVGWDDQPITVGRLCAELYAQIHQDDWSYLAGTEFQARWPQQLWNATKTYQYIGDAGAFGLGYCAPASLGGALANRAHGRLSVTIQPDGDLMMSNGVLWTAAHHKIPLLYVMHNNRAYHQEIMALQLVANRRQRGVGRTEIGTQIKDPNIDYAMLAKSMGVYGEGPITNPNDLGPALKRAIAVVKRGEPALVDVVAQGR